MKHNPSLSDVAYPAPDRDRVLPDNIFDTPTDAIQDFSFNSKVASVFDDMVDRSVPYYREIQRMTGQLAADFAVPGTRVYDLGCATGTSMVLMDGSIDTDVTLVGLDNSAEMLNKCREKLKDAKVTKPFELLEADLNRDVVIENASVVLLVLTLQFVRPLYRERLMKQIFDGLNPGGCVILVEKVLGESSHLNRLSIDHYYEYKKSMGYSSLEISQKREALENVLVPYRLTENLELLQRLGFNQQDTFFKWYNFCGIIAVK
ncbi:MAG: carboxy-S-adenosyl-L-methionine synthase CmoA [Verrucomicrobiales bacterium]|nr:carboxy-S-adenosyl-L-methionine synthase CmoA [Verrucomicrobiales bacterium]MBP9224049.1 carboxy-S-adenosyl-L-methionine synthase CmoA [Verrucomicrobiales bacterium]HQZ26899.1 carboxy-S-adenosyl-L-methionine synthase CmoA [Verrucomicrobiales bacterium]